ncbi:MAG: PD-(D/E)XK nuclease family protein [Bacillota bacterium]
MPLERKREPDIIPSYSLTGDLLSFLRCGLQYRYHNGSALPPSRPVQLWFGEFIHGVMEAAYRLWSSSLPAPAFPWPCNPTPYLGTAPAGRAPHDIGTIGDMVEETLRAQGKTSRSSAVRDSAYRRAEAAVNEVAPHLFPLVALAEERVIGTRNIPLPGAGMANLRTNRYELHGVIDVLTDMQLNSVPSSNVIREAIITVCPQLPPHFEIVVDYKGDRRPATNHPFWAQAEWQVQTYAWLRMRQPNALPVPAGVLIYVNELAPVSDDLQELQREIRQGTTDVVPANGSQDAYLLSLWQPGLAIPSFSQAFRMQRAIRVVPVTQQSQINATSQFDSVVLQIEQCVAAEASTGTIRGHWIPGGDADTCVACDFRHFCPNPAPRHGSQPRRINAPAAP